MRASQKSRRIYFPRRDTVGSQILPIRRGYFIVDAKDYARVRKHKWYLHSGKYVRAEIDGEKIYLHRFLMNVPKGLEIDHINGNPCDNRRSNMRFATRQQNLFNCRSKRPGLKGVCYDKRNKYWVSLIMCNYKSRHLGHYPTELLAAKAYDKAARILFGNFARTNFKSSGATA